MKEYTIGIDFGTLSARAVLLDIQSGNCAGDIEFQYSHAIMTDEDFEGITLKKTDALQHPDDYIEALKFLVPHLLEGASAEPSSVKGIGIDFTSSTILPVKSDMTPLSSLDEFKNNPHAYAKLWKHHSAASEAELMEKTARERDEKWLSRYGGKISSEWMMPKVLETADCAPDVFEAADRFIEAADWIVSLLVGSEVHSSCMAGFKAFWSKKDGYPDNEYFKAVSPKLDNIIGTKISENVASCGKKAGTISDAGKSITSLEKNCTVAVPIIDAHASLPAAGLVRPNELMLIIGTSGCHIMMDRELKSAEGLCGVVEDGIIPGYFSYEAGQSCVGDCFAWFSENMLPVRYFDEAKERKINIFDLMNEKAAKLKVGESGLTVLDWWNGNRSPYANPLLSAVISGLTIKTKPEEIYRAIIESVAFGTKAIVDTYEKNGISVNKVFASGGICEKNEFLMQIYSDVLGREICVTDSKQSAAKGGAVLASYAAECFDTIENAAEKLSDKVKKIYTPDRRNTEDYFPLYKNYLKLADFFAENR